MILAGSASQAFAAALADATGEPLATAEYDRFSDGELLATVPGELSGRVVVAAATVSSDAHVELLQLQDAAREAGAGEVVTVLPYVGYARQDDAFTPGEPVSARAVARAISTGADRVLTVTPHEERVLDFFDVPATAVDAAPRLATALPADLSEPLFLAPDESATALAASVRDAHGDGATDYFEKERDRETGEVSVQPSDAPVADRDVVIVDDIVATGGTMSQAVAACRDRDAARTFAACVHPVLAGNALARLRAAGVERVVATDTVERPVSTVSAAPAVAEDL